MLVYIFQAALLCEACGEHEKERLTEAGKAPADPSDEQTYDSDDFPKGPTEEGESDSPSYCDECGLFLESPLTSEGVQYVEEAIDDFARSGGKTGNPPVIAEWSKYYGGGWKID